VRATDVVQRHAPHFLLPFYVIAAAAALLLPPTSSTRAVCAVHFSPPPVPPNVGQRSRKGRPHLHSNGLLYRWGGSLGYPFLKLLREGMSRK
jgi:hypothetical protein